MVRNGHRNLRAGAVERRVIFALIPVAVAVLALALLVWRFMRGNEEMEPGGSWGVQFFSRRKKQRDNC